MKPTFFILLAVFGVRLWAAPLNGADLFTGQPVEIAAGEKGTVVVFLSAQCPCSASHAGEIKKIAAEYPAFRFVGVHSNSNEGKELTQGYFKDVKLNFPVLQDTDGKIAEQFRALKTPHAFLVAGDGKILYKGGVTDSKDCSKSGRNFLREALEDVSKGKKVRTAEARTLGCAISRGGKSDW